MRPHAWGVGSKTKIITLDPRLSNTAAKSDIWLPTWPGSETWVLLAVANHLISNRLQYLLISSINRIRIIIQHPQPVSISSLRTPLKLMNS